MGRSMTIQGLADTNDETYRKMLAVKKACDAAKIKYPLSVDDFFQGSTHDDEPLKIDIDDSVVEIDNDLAAEWRIDLSKLSQSVKFIKVTYG